MNSGKLPAALPSVSYVLPLRWTTPGPIEELAEYLRLLDSTVDEVLVVDGSPTPLFKRHAVALDGVAQHLTPDPDLDFPSGKVNGVITGVRRSSNEFLILADDDVRYDLPAVERIVSLLAAAELVRPQNYFDHYPWHARWDSARSLLNRVFTGDLTFPVGDFPGTLAVRQKAFRHSGAYDGNALFENLELMRTIRSARGRILTPLDLYVARRPPSARHFFSQRVRQAYDDFAIPARMAVFLAVLPLVAEGLRRDRGECLAGMAFAAMVAAEIGRRKAGGTKRFPLSGSLLAPAWILERSVCSWLALGARVRGGVKYGEHRFRHSATSMRSLRKRYASARAAESSQGLPVAPLSA